MSKGVFVISLDFELQWGVFDSLGKDYDKNILGARHAIPQILEEFNKYNVHATWATVGFLFADNKKEIKKISPAAEKRPVFKDRKLSSYRVNIGDDENSDPLHYARTLINEIQSIPGQEIGTHTFSHYYCLEPGQTKEQFEEDIKAAVALSEKRGSKLKSIVFPKNQINPQYLPLLKKHGLNVYRGNPPSYIYDANKTKGFKRLDKQILRLLDSYINITGPNTCYLESLAIHNGLLCIPGSSFLRPYSKKMSFLEPLKLRRIKKAMHYAAKQNQLYHLWWHPHNFGKNKEENLINLKSILSHFSYLNQKYDMKSLNMEEVHNERFKSF